MAKNMGSRQKELIAGMGSLILLFLLGMVTPVISQPERKLTFDRGGIVRGPADDSRVALVFSADFYGQGIGYVLDELKRQGIKASFFLTGNFLRQTEFRPLVERMVEAGHYVGPHSDRHLLYCDWQDREKTLVSKEEFLADLNANYAELGKFGVTREKARYFLPPYEWYNRQIVDWAKETGVVIVNFTPGLITNADYTTPDMENYRGSEEIYRQLLGYESSAAAGLNGFIILIHPGVAPERTDLFYFRLGQLIDELRGRGYDLVTIDQLLSKEPEETGKEVRQIGDEEKAKSSDLFSSAKLEANSRQGQTGDRAAREDAIFSLTGVRVDWLRGKVSGLAVLKDKALVAVESPGGLACYLVSIGAGEQPGSSPFAEGANLRFAAGKEGFWLTADGKLVFIDAETGRIRLKSSEIEELPVAGPLETEGRIIFGFKRSLKAFDSESGQTLWTLELPDETAGPVAVAGRNIFVAGRSGLVVGLDSASGREIFRHDFKEEINGLVAGPGHSLFLMTAAGRLVGFNWKKARVGWKFNPGSRPVGHLLPHGRYLYLLTPGGILYKLKRSGGDVVWWQTVPGRTPFRPAIVENEIIVPCGEVVHGFDLSSGRKSSETILSFELKTNLEVSNGLLLAGVYDYRQELSLVYSLKKEPKVIIRARPESPQPAGRRIIFNVLTAGWNRPRFEFYLRSGSDREILVRKASALNTWTWFPTESGEYTISVRVIDGKLSKKTELRYNITSLAGQ
ncbi:MAG: PQQ-binding-like beta-propeller repeat protein [Candidatus Saccharicenans sp.]|nr:PQQ-binding-like beta-propeller repeat protein [Candidatus Saccharicenans sp.]